MAIWEIIRQTLMITSFVAVMMLLVEYLNVSTRGTWQTALVDSKLTQYIAAVLLGGLPGCLGAFVVVTLYMHRTVSFGAVVACMIATSGDEAFVMLAMFPFKAVIIMLGLAVLGLVVGMATDFIVRSRGESVNQHELPLHEGDEHCRCFSKADVLPQLRHPTNQRVALIAGLVIFLSAIGIGALGPQQWNWVRISLLIVGLFALFVVTTVPQHFLKEHLWDHVVRQHVPRIFAWTLAAISIVALVSDNVGTEAFLRDNPWMTMGVASLLGIIPESGPHLVFVTLFDQGSVPISTLVASSIVQDGHGMLPLFAHSWRDFLAVKGINLLVGISVGALLLGLGW